MKTCNHLRSIGLAAAVAITLTACGGSQAPAIPSSSVAADSAHPLAYNAYIYFPGMNERQHKPFTPAYTYPKGNLALTLSGFKRMQGGCSDPNGNVYIVDSGAATVSEYPHRQHKPILILNDAGSVPYSCSVDPTTGNVAVTNAAYGSSPGSVAVFSTPSEPPVKLTDTNISSYAYATYDDSGNLFVDGTDGSYGFRLAELSAGSSGFTDISVDEGIAAPGGLQWINGLTVGDAVKHVIYEVSVSGSVGSVTATTPLTGNGDGGLYAAVRTSPIKTIIVSCIDSSSGGCTSKIEEWSFPKGGNPSKGFAGISVVPTGIIVSHVPTP